MVTVKFFFILFALNFLVASQIFSQTVSIDNKDTIHITSQLSKKHIMLPTANNFIHLIPPHRSFVVDEERTRVQFGLFSKKYDATMRIAFRSSIHRSTYSDDVNQLKLSHRILKYELLRINDVNVKYFKLNPLNDESQINWVIFCDNDFFSLYIVVSYNKKYDRALSKRMESFIRSIIIAPNPSVTPTSNMSMVGDYSLFDLKFVQRLSVPLSYFTEDGIPAATTRGSKIVILGTPPTVSLDTINIAEKAIRDLNLMLRQHAPNDYLIPLSMRPTEFATYHGVIVEGILASNHNKTFIGIYSNANDPKIPFYGILGICNEDEKEEFFERIHRFKLTVAS